MKKRACHAELDSATNFTFNYLKSKRLIPKRERRLLLYFVLCTIYFIPNLKAQNLVPNYSFEDTIQCAQTYDEFTGYVRYWTGGGGGGPSYFNSYNGISVVGEPSNEYGYEYAHTGVSYAGIYTFVKPDPEERSYIQDSLISPLITGVRYYVTFYVSLADTDKYACNNIGAYFSPTSTVFSDYSGGVIPFNPQISNDTAHNPLTSKINWMRVSGSFIAAGGEQYILIGNFVDDLHCDTIFVNSLVSSTNPYFWTAAYYYIDDVIVSTDSTYADSLFTGVQEFKRNEPSANIYPNPASTLLNVAVNIAQLKAGSICLYNTTGEKVRCETLSGNITSISITDLPSGLYYYRITDSAGNLVKADKVIIIK